MMTSSEHQSYETITVEGKITGLSYQPKIDEEKAQLSLVKLTTTEDKIFTFYNCSQKYKNPSDCNTLINAKNLQAFKDIIQKSFHFSNAVSISFQGQDVINIKAIRKQSSSLVTKKAHSEPAYTIKANLPIQVYCSGKLISRHQDAFDAAAARWSEIIIGGSPRIRVDGDISKGIIIQAFTSHIDGPGKILGGALPIDIQAGWILPNTGWMILDSNDIYRMEDQGILIDVILHEIGHILGLGTLWGPLGLTKGIGTENPVFLGKKAMYEFTRLMGYSTPVPVPLENEGRFGTRDCHWRESLITNELMTSLMGGKINPISRLTIAALEDIGYQVNYDAADPYTDIGIRHSDALSTNQTDISSIYCSISEL